jgi:hypothetical protein
VVLYVHLSEDALRTNDPDAPVRVENAGGQLLTAGQVAEWCARPDTGRPTTTTNKLTHTPPGTGGDIGVPKDA